VITSRQEIDSVSGSQGRDRLGSAPTPVTLLHPPARGGRRRQRIRMGHASPPAVGPTITSRSRAGHPGRYGIHQHRAGVGRPRRRGCRARGDRPAASGVRAVCHAQQLNAEMSWAFLALVENRECAVGQFSGLPEDPADTASQARRDPGWESRKGIGADPIEAFRLNSSRAPSPSKAAPWRRNGRHVAAVGPLDFRGCWCGRRSLQAPARPGPDPVGAPETVSGEGGHGEPDRKAKDQARARPRMGGASAALKMKKSAVQRQKLALWPINKSSKETHRGFAGRHWLLQTAPTNRRLRTLMKRLPSRGICLQTSSRMNGNPGRGSQPA